MLKNYFRSALFYIVYISSGIITGVVGCLFCPFMPINYRLKFLSYWPKFINWILYKLCDIEFEVIGQENIPEAPFVVVSNHQGQWETFFYQYFFFPLTTLLKRELLFIPIWGWALALLRPIAINRGSPRRALKKTILEGEKRIKSGFIFLNFPEGTRNNPGEVGNYARSGFELAIKTQVPVLPLAHNSGDIWPAHKFLKYPGKLKLIIGKPLVNLENSSKAAKETEAWTKLMLKKIRYPS